MTAIAEGRSVVFRVRYGWRRRGWGVSCWVVSRNRRGRRQDGWGRLLDRIGFDAIPGLV
jgi:hypothetical protein